MPNYDWLIMVLAGNGRYEKRLELPFVPQIGMSIFRSGNPMWSGKHSDFCDTPPKISGVGYDLDEDRFEVEIVIDRDVELTSAFWDEFIPL